MSPANATPRPCFSAAVGGLQVAVWENPVDNGDGVERTTKSVTLRRSYFNRKTNNFVEAKLTLFPQELGTLIALLTEAQKAVIDRRGEPVDEPSFP